MKPQRTLAAYAALTVALLFAAGCNKLAEQRDSLTLATTTSMRDSGLLDMLVPRFREQTGVDVRVVAVGSGQAMELGRRGDADVLITHAPAAEQKFIEEGWGQDRRPIMYNDFILVGPAADPAMVNGQTSIIESFTRIAEREAPFVSRGDESGTHQREIEIWTKAGREPKGDWYIHAGTGMANALRMAHEKHAYILADRGTFLSHRKDIELEILSDREPLLQNNYAVLIPNSKKHPHLNSRAARQFADFLTAPATKTLIADFGVDKFGEPLFYPAE